MNKLKSFIKQHKYSLLIAVFLIAMLLTWNFMNSFSETTTDSAWDGVVARQFTSGTGSTDNPYVIANASEFAYFKSLLEGEDASLYAHKNYKLVGSFNYGKYDLAINNKVPFSGTIDGCGNKIYNASLSNMLFNILDGATIKNLQLVSLSYTLINETGAIVANDIKNSNIEMLLVNCDVNVQNDSTFGGLVYNSSDTTYKNIIIDYNIDSENENIFNFAYTMDNDNGANILIKDNNYQNTYCETNINFNKFNIKDGNINLIDVDNLNEFVSDNYKIIIKNNEFNFEEITNDLNNEFQADDSSEHPNEHSNMLKSVVRNSTITVHDQGIDGTTIYINNLLSDSNYFKGLNHTEVLSTSIPSGASTGYYDDSNLVKVAVVYDGTDINNANLVGAVSPINSENVNKYVYYKYYPLERTSSGDLATDNNGNNYIRIELIDNPFSKRPYVSTTEYGFNGWACNQGNSSDGVCESATFSFDNDIYTRYVDIAIDGSSEFTLYLNANWINADVVTSYYNISSFNSMTMENLPTHPVQYVIHHIASPHWKQNYTTMEYYQSYNRYSQMPTTTGYYYKTSTTSTTYYRLRNGNRTCQRTTCYVYRANTSGITSGSLYEGGTVEFFPNYNASSNTIYSTTISDYNTTYMNLVDDPNGTIEYDETATANRMILGDGSTAGSYYYKVTNPTAAMINTGEYYNSDGSVCTNANNCRTAYKLIQYNDTVTNSDGTSIYNINADGNGNIIDQDNYYYLVTRDTNIFRYTSTTALEMDYLQVNKPFTVTGTAVNGTSVTGVLEYPTGWGWDSSAEDFTASNDIVIENIKIYGPGGTGSDNLGIGDDDSYTSYVIYANSKNLKIGRNVVSSRDSSYLVANGIFNGTNTSVTGRFKVIVESGIYSAFHTGPVDPYGRDGSRQHNTTTSTYNALTVLGSDYDRVKVDNSKLKFFIGLDGMSGGYNNALSGNFIAFTTVKSGMYGFNADGTPSTDYTAGLYLGGHGYTDYFQVNNTTGAKIEGGKINIVVGGVGYSGSATTNANYIGMSGGEVRQIYGGAGTNTTKGNRIINVTGGTINYSILGGSNSSSSNSSTDGIVDGDTLVYVGGNVTVGTENDELYLVESGSIFGAGGGNTNYSSLGTVKNSHVIINGGTINKSVYGGGNFGSTGTQSSSAASTVIDIYKGTIGNVYGGSKSAGFSTSQYASSSTIDINMTGGTVGNIYGGSNEKGTIYGSTDIDITGGTISNNIYGGGQGENTFVTNDVDVTIGVANVANTPTVGGNVYGGSAFGTVNCATTSGNATGDTTVTVDNGLVTGSVFGGGQGSSTATPYVLGDITVNINGGDITSVFGGNDQAGSHTAVNEVYLNGGIIENVYGGGNRSSVTNTNIYMDGSTVTNIYGGSNTLGNVSTTNVDILSGTVQNVYGGNNEGGTCGTTDVNVTGTASINGSIYGGGNQVATTTTTVTLNSANGTVPNVYGGGNSASVTTSNVTNNGVTATNIFGGSNSSGTVTTANVTYNSGTSTNVYGGNNAGGNTVTSNIDINNGTITTVYGGGNQANGGTSNVDIGGGNITSVFGGGNSAGLTQSNINVTAGTVGDVYGGSNNSGTVTIANIDVATGTITNIYGGGNRAEVGTPTVVVDGGAVANIYGGGNLAQVTGNTIVDINGGTISGNVYGGGNYGVVKGSSNVTITNATILGNAYGGGNGSSATLEGNTNITIDGNTTIGNASSVAPNSGCVFGGGNQALTGIQDNNNSTSSVNIVGGTINGNVYGGAKFSVIYGNTIVNIGETAYTSNSLTKSDIYVKGNVFGGGEANSSGSEIYDWSFISVTQGVNISIDADTYQNFQIDGSFFGGGNASSATGDSYLTIRNYGSGMNPKRNVSIQRVTYVTIDNSSILLAGAIDRANEYDNELFSISRVDDFKLQNNSYIFFVTGANLLKNFQSLDSSGNPAVVTITDDYRITNRSVDNRVYMYEGKNLNVAEDQQVTVYGEVTGMSFFGIFNYANGGINTGIYSNQYGPGDTLDWSGLFAKGSYVLGKHLTNHNIKVNGFYSNFMNEETQVNEVNYIDPTPKDSQFYMWYIGENIIEYNVNLVASKYSTLGSVEQSFLEFSKPNTSFQIESFDISDIASGISLVDKNNIPRIAANNNDANNIFGLAMEASNNGWLTTGKTSFYTTSPWMQGVTYYEGENSTVVPTMLFYLYHSKNITETKDLGTVRITIKAITKINALSSEVERLVVNVNMSTALFQTTEYEGAMTPGDKYDLFTSTTTNITTKSKFSVYYGLYSAGTNIYQSGYHRALTSSYILPENTKITMIDFGTGTTEYYYHVITAQDVANAQSEFQSENECSYNLSLFTRMGSLNNNSNYDDAAKNAIYYDGTNSSEEFIFIVDFSDTDIQSDQLEKKLLIEIRDANDEGIITVLGIQHDQLTYNLYSGKDSIINETVVASANPLYIGYNDTFEVSIDYQNSNLSGVAITDTQYFDSKLGVQIAIKDARGNVVSGTDLTGAYFLIDGTRYYPDIAGYTHIKLANKVGNTKKWIIFNTENASLGTGSYTFTFEAFASTDGIYYSSGASSFVNLPIDIINSKYGLNPVLNEDSVIFNEKGTDRALKFTINYTSLLSNPNLRIALYRREYDEIYDIDYDLVDLQDYVSSTLTTTANPSEYLLSNSPSQVNTYALLLNDDLMTGTYRLAFRLYDSNTMIGEINQYIVIK